MIRRNVWGDKNDLFSPLLTTLEMRRYRIYPDTYPWPYREKDFASWEFSDETGNYTLICDPAGFVVRHCTSYCAWKIRELTGRWPKKRSSRKMYHAKYWQEFLAENGFTVIVDSPEDRPEGCYVGIEVDRGEYGQVYWYEKQVRDWDGLSRSRMGVALATLEMDCTTYMDGQFKSCEIEAGLAKKMVWVQIK